MKYLFTRFLYSLTIFISVITVTVTGSAGALTNNFFQSLQTPFYDPDYLDTCTVDTTDNSQNQPAQIDLTSIVQKYDIDTVLVKPIGQDGIGSYKSADNPNSPASVLKLVIADVFLSSSPNLDKEVTVKAHQVYDPPGDNDNFNPRAGKKIILREALKQMLTYSSDTTANVLIDEAGGLKTASATAAKLGYKDTEFGAYYSDSATKVLNKTTVTDLTAAMENLFTNTGGGYQVARNDLSDPDRNTFGIDSDASKWGGVPGTSTGKPATGNSALFNIGSSKYIVTMYANRPYNGNNSPAVGNIRDATNEIVRQLRASSTSFNNQTTSSCSACSVVAAGGVARFVQTLAFKESGGNPVAGDSSGAKGKYQYMDSTWQSHAKSYYAPAAQFSTASAAPESVQDAVAYIEYSVKYEELKGDLFKMAVSHYLPAALEDPSRMDVVPPGNTETPRQYANNFLEDLNTGKGKSIPLKFNEAPDFATWYQKALGHSYAADTSTSRDTTGCSGGIPSDSMVFYEQYDDKWADHAYGSSTIAESGCGPTSVAMVVATLADRTVTPIQTADFGTSNNSYIPGVGSSHQRMLVEGPQHWGLRVTPLGTNLERAATFIRNGGLVIAGGTGQHPFSGGGHIIVLRGLDKNGRFLVANPAPNLQNGRDQSFSASDLTNAGLSALFGVIK